MSFDLALLGLRLLAAALLYLFLGLAFYLLWRDLAASGPATVRPGDKLQLLDAGGLAGNGQATTFWLRPVTTLGRSADNTVVVLDEFASVIHARLTWRGGVWWLEDLDSRTGTFLNGAVISRPTPLAPGDVIGIGQARLRLESGQRAERSRSE